MPQVSACALHAHILCLAVQDEESMAAKLQLLAEGCPGELLVLVQVPDLLPSAAPPPAPDLAAARQRSLRREDQPPAAIAQGLKSLPAGKVHCWNCNQHSRLS